MHVSNVNINYTYSYSILVDFRTVTNTHPANTPAGNLEHTGFWPYLCMYVYDKPSQTYCEICYSTGSTHWGENRKRNSNTKRHYAQSRRCDRKYLGFPKPAKRINIMSTCWTHYSNTFHKYDNVAKTILLPTLLMECTIW